MHGEEVGGGNVKGFGPASMARGSTTDTSAVVDLHAEPADSQYMFEGSNDELPPPPPAPVEFLAPQQRPQTI